MNVGERWAYRERPRTPGTEVRAVEVLQLGPNRSRKVRVRWLDGEFDGLDEWVSAIRLVVPWEHIDEFLDDECRMLALEAVQPDAVDDVTANAVQQVWFAVDSAVEFYVQKGSPLVATIENVDEITESLPVEVELLKMSPGAFCDSKGTLFVGQDMALRLAKGYCSLQAERVLTRERAELEPLRRAVVSGWYTSRLGDRDPWRIDHDKAEVWLHEEEASWALVRQWCGADAEVAFDERVALREEVQRLNTLLLETADWLKNAGHPQKAALLRRTAQRVD